MNKLINNITKLGKSFYGLVIYFAIADAEKDVVGSPVYHRMEKAIYHYERNNLTDFSKRLDTVIEKLKEEFRGQME